MTAYTRSTGYPTPVSNAKLRHSITRCCKFGIVNLIPIRYASRPLLRIRLTLRRLTLLRKPEAYGVKVSHLDYRYSCRHGLFQPLYKTSQLYFDATAMLSYHNKHMYMPIIRSFGNILQSRSSSVQYHSTSELLRTL